MSGYIISIEEIINIKEHKIFSFDFLQKTDLNIHIVKNNILFYSANIVQNASYYGHVDVLEWYKNSGYDITIYNIYDGFISVSQTGHVKILKWFKKLGYESNREKHKLYATYMAVLNNNLNVIKWYKKNNYFKYNKTIILDSFRKTKILKFFINKIKVHSKKIIKFSNNHNLVKLYRFKTKNNYIKGYNKN